MKLLFTLVTSLCFLPLSAYSEQELSDKCASFNSIARSHTDQIAPFTDTRMNEEQAIKAVKSQLKDGFVPYPKQLKKELETLVQKGAVTKKMLTWKQKVPGIIIEGRIITQNTVAQRMTLGYFLRKK